MRSSPLLETHRSLGARLVDFAGWEMPLQYEGIVAEHRAVRGHCGIFDVSHLGKLRVTGPGAIDAVQRAVTCDVAGLGEGRAAYGLVLQEDGGCIDDVFVYRIGADEMVVVPNAANVTAVAAALADAGAAQVTDEWDRWAILAVQGPRAFDVIESAFGIAAAGMPLHTWAWHDFAGGTGFVARTGYTGERGAELYVPAAAAEGAWRAATAAGAVPVGLGARDTLRLEMGYALYGNELDTSVNPLEAGLGWAISWDAPFRGRDALRRVKEAGPLRRTFGIRCTDRGVPRHGYRVLHGSEPVGEITSGNFSPTLGTGIALARGPAASIPPPGAEVAVEARGRAIAGVIVKPPFVSRDRPATTG